MNIKKAKEEIKNAMRAYFTKDEFGSYLIPVEKQRPVFLMGPPGIGKTAIMEQIAQELGVGLVSYSMTHHTRQSALGLPFIEKKTYGGKEYSVSEYTMSEIIASVYDMMEKTGLKEGILFLDEINCVSETLAPSMLQFLQYKIFGRHRVPDGWIVVTAGNPPEYNNSVREFDIVTWDRLKRIDVEPDYQVWKEHALNVMAHPAIFSYLEVKTADFYKIETTVDGKSFVTARGWLDLSDMIRLYEKNNIPVTEDLVGQYLQNRKIAREFSLYYDLFRKYRSDYEIPKILEGKAPKIVVERAHIAKFDERLAVLGLLTEAVTEKTKTVCLEEKALGLLTESLKGILVGIAGKKKDPVFLIAEETEKRREALETGKSAGTLSADEIHAENRNLQLLSELSRDLVDGTAGRTEDPAAALAAIRKFHESRAKQYKSMGTKTGKALENAFRFCEDAFGDGQEMLIFVTELTASRYDAQFISRFGCDEYFRHNKELLFYERQKELIREIEDLELE